MTVVVGFRRLSRAHARDGCPRAGRTYAAQTENDHWSLSHPHYRLGGDVRRVGDGDGGQARTRRSPARASFGLWVD